MIDKETAKVLAMDLIKELSLINPIIFRDMDEERKNKVIDRTSKLIALWVELKVMEALTHSDDEKAIQAQRDAVNALVVSVLSQLGIAKERMQKTLTLALVKLGQNFAAKLVGMALNR